MRILHVSLASHVTPGLLYQDNMLAKINARDGHDVLIVSDTERFVDGKLVDGDECDVILESGIRFIRLKADKIINKFVSNKVYKCRKLIKIIEGFKPDAILFHGTVGYELITISDYVKDNKNVLFYSDVHSAFNNSSRTVLARIINKFVQGYFINIALPYIRKVLCIAPECMEYMNSLYGVPKNKMELFPLGGEICDVDKCNLKRAEIISKYNLPNDAIILCHSGKFDELKKTKDLLEAFNQCNNEKLYLFIIGRIELSIEKSIKDLINCNNRVINLGWQSGEFLKEFLLAVDLYCQPGSNSATLQAAACSNCAIMCRAFPIYTDLFGKECYYIDGVDSIKKFFDTISVELVNEQKKKIFEIAKQKLDYNVLANRYLHE